MPTAQAQPRYDLFFIPVLLALGAIVGLAWAAKSPDWAMQMQGWTFFACMMGTGIWYLKYYAYRTPPDERQLYANDVVKAGVIASMFWAVAGMTVGLLLALQLSFPHLFYFPDLPWTNFGRMRPLHTPHDLCLRRQCPDHDVLLCRAAHLQGQAVGRFAALVCVLGLQHLHRAGGHRLSAGHHPEQGICGAGMVRRRLADHRLGLLSADLPWHFVEAQGADTTS